VEFGPFCVRVQLVLGWKNIPYEIKAHGYGDALGDDDAIANKGAYQSSTYLTGKKGLPVLELADGAMIPESGDIIAFLEDATGPGNILLPPPSGRADLRTFFAYGGDFANLLKALAYPRLLRMTHMKSMSGQGDREYFRRRFDNQNGFSLAAAEAADSENKEKMERLLVELDGLLRTEDSFNDGACGLTMDDVMYLPNLKTLSCVDGLRWPTRLRRYADASFAAAGPNVHLDFDWEKDFPSAV